MAIKIDPSPARGDFETAARQFIKAAWKACTADYFGGAEELYNAVKALRDKNENIEQRAWTLWRECVAASLGRFFEITNLTRRPDNEKEFTRIVSGILQHSRQVAEDEGAELLESHLRRPQDFPLYQALRKDFPLLIRQVAPEHTLSDKDVRLKLDSAFSYAFPRVWMKGAEHYREVSDALSGTVGEIARREEEWRRYYELLRQDVEAVPLFGQDEGGPTLHDIFVPLRCYWFKRPPKIARNEEVREPTTVHVRMLQAEIARWLEAKDRSDTLRVVTGGPGSGKSSTAKIIARDVSRDGYWNVYFVPLQGLRVDAQPDAIVSAFVREMSVSPDQLSHSPIDRLREDVKPLLLIFDGLDEVARSETGDAEVMRKFVGNLNNWLSRINAPGVKVMALVLGRPQAAEAAARENAVADQAVLHVAPLCKLDEAGNDESEHDWSLRSYLREQDRIDDPYDLVETDQRHEFWRNWASAQPDYPEDAPDGLFDDALKDLTVEPLLLYLLIYSGLAVNRAADAAENRNRVYEEIFRKVHERDVKKTGAETKKGLQEAADFFTLMECLGLAAWAGGGRTGTNDQFRRLRDEIYAPEKTELFSDLQNADLDNVALQFYTSHDRRDQPGYAFIHKSFGEYLTARALIDASSVWLDDYIRKPRPQEFARHWLKLTGAQPITYEIVDFMADEARLRVKPRASDDLDWAKARKKIGPMCRLAEWILKHGFPAHEALGIGYGDDALSWRRREDAQCHAESAFFAVLYVWGLVAFPDGLLGEGETEGGWSAGAIKITWPFDHSAFRLIERLRRRSYGGLLTRTPSGALRPVDPEHRFLRATEIANATLTNASLSGMNLSSADLSSADLSGANLISANLMGADLSHAILSHANLISANLRHANCRRMQTDSCCLQFADLSEAVELSEEAVNAARGNSATKLPASIDPPDWPQTKYQTWQEAIIAGDPDG